MAGPKSASTDREFVQELMDELTQLSTVVETFKLPTLGRLDGISPEVTMRMMTTHEEKIRVGSKASFFKTISSIMNKCVVEPKGLDTYRLTVVDFIFLMYKLRIISYGKDYKVNLPTCPECERALKDPSIDLDKLKINYIENDFSEPFSIKLPKTGWDIECRMLRMNEFDEIQTEARKHLEQYPDYEGDPTIPLRLARQIVTIKGTKLTKAQLEMIVNKLPAEDENKISNTLESIKMGMELFGEFTCPHCGKTMMLPLSMSEEFFRPTLDK